LQLKWRLQPSIAADNAQIGRLSYTDLDVIVYVLKAIVHISKTVVDLL
jgi:hypothetical protein